MGEVGRIVIAGICLAALSCHVVEVATAAGQVAGTLELPKTGWDQAGDTAPLTIQLREGFNTLRLTTRAETSGFHLHHLDVRPTAPGSAR